MAAAREPATADSGVGAILRGPGAGAAAAAEAMTTGSGTTRRGPALPPDSALGGIGTEATAAAGLAAAAGVAGTAATGRARALDSALACDATRTLTKSGTSADASELITSGVPSSPGEKAATEQYPS